MGEESIAPKPRARRQGTVEDGRKRSAAEKEELSCAQESRRSDLEKGEKEEKKSQQKKREDPIPRFNLKDESL